MTTDERLDRLTGVVDKLAASVAKYDPVLQTLSASVAKYDTVLETLSGTVVAHDSVLEAHDRQIGALITLAEKNLAAITKQRERSERLEREWQAYLKTLRRQ